MTLERLAERQESVVLVEALAEVARLRERNAALVAALNVAEDDILELVNSGWSSLSERHARAAVGRIRALLAESAE